MLCLNNIYQGVHFKLYLHQQNSKSILFFLNFKYFFAKLILLFNYILGVAFILLSNQSLFYLKQNTLVRIMLIHNTIYLNSL